MREEERGGRGRKAEEGEQQGARRAKTKYKDKDE
jgi:hypothetical protein